jgi:hypothetical protein
MNSVVRAFRRRGVLLLCILAAMAAAVASASAAVEQFAYNTPMNSGQSYYSGTYRGSIFQVYGWGGGTAYSGVWVSNSSLARVSADGYCSTNGCTANVHWTGPYPAGYPTVHHHGNAALAYFNGTDGYN